MNQMPRGVSLTKEMIKALPLYCYAEKRAIQTIAQQGVSVDETTRLEIVMNVHYTGEAGGIVCRIKCPNAENALVISVTHLRFVDAGEMYDKINEYKKARIAWLDEEERQDRRLGLPKRIKNISVLGGGPSDDGGPKISKNAPCPCGSGKKYKQCCMK